MITYKVWHLLLVLWGGMGWVIAGYAIAQWMGARREIRWWIRASFHVPDKVEPDVPEPTCQWRASNGMRCLAYRSHAVHVDPRLGHPFTLVDTREVFTDANCASSGGSMHDRLVPVCVRCGQLINSKPQLCNVGSHEGFAVQYYCRAIDATRDEGSHYAIDDRHGGAPW